MLRSDTAAPGYLQTSGAGWFKEKNPSVSIDLLEAAWLDGAAVLYIGKAGAGKRGTRGLRKRLSEYRRHGAGEKIGHWGGRYIWQLEDHSHHLVAWKITPGVDPEDVETELINEFVLRFGAKPFANRKRRRSVRM